jgi:hypothetical protein
MQSIAYRCKGTFSVRIQAYSAGKVVAMNASETYIASHNTIFDVVTIIPGWIFGRDELANDVEVFHQN